MTDTDAQPIVLERVFFTKTIIESIQAHVPVEGEQLAPPENTLNVEKVDDQGLFAVQMRSVLNAGREKTAPYFIDIEAVALLRVVDKKLTEEHARGGALVTGHNVLYGAIRESISWSTGRHAFGAVMLGLSMLKHKAQSPPKP